MRPRRCVFRAIRDLCEKLFVLVLAFLVLDFVPERLFFFPLQIVHLLVRLLVPLFLFVLFVEGLPLGLPALALTASFPTFLPLVLPHFTPTDI